MNVVDLVLVVAMLVFAITGWRRAFCTGCCRSRVSSCGAAVGLWLAPKLVGSWDDGVCQGADGRGDRLLPGHAWARCWSAWWDDGLHGAVTLGSPRWFSTSRQALCCP